MVNKQKGQQFFSLRALSTCIFKAQVESKHHIELTVSEDHKVNPQIVHFTFVALCGEMLFLIVILAK